MKEKQIGKKRKKENLKKTKSHNKKSEWLRIEKS